MIPIRRSLIIYISLYYFSSVVFTTLFLTGLPNVPGENFIPLFQAGLPLIDILVFCLDALLLFDPEVPSPPSVLLTNTPPLFFFPKIL